MKIAFGLMAVLAIVGYFVFTSGDFANFDPSAQGRETRAAIETGMSWEEVAVHAGEPKKYRTLQRVQQGTGATAYVAIKEGPQNNFNADSLRKRVEDGSLPEGFVFEYRFSQSVAFKTIFDSAGALTSIEDMVTMADLLDMPGG